MLFLLLLTLNIYAQPITQDEAEIVASNFLLGKSNNLKSTIDGVHFKDVIKTLQFKSDNNAALIYVFDVAEKGFVLTGANEYLPPIIGYSLENNFDLQNLPPALDEMIKGWENVYIQTLKSGVSESEYKNQWDQLKNNVAPKVKGESVAPLLGDIIWDQRCLYNLMCPEDEDGKCGHARVGCVATAMGQIMKYWEYPENGQGEFSYTPWTNPKYGMQSVNFAEAHYDWSKIPNTLNDESSQEEINETAKLLYHCGVANEMDYGPIVSLAGTPIAQWSDYFNYSDKTYYKQFRPDDIADAHDIIQFELDHKCPILILTDHAFVCDGYDGLYYHLNWGWDGFHNGNYLLSTQYVYGFSIAGGITPEPRNIACNLQDSLALVDLYNSTDGDNWTNNENWLTGPVSEWYGIKTVTDRVYEINLSYNNLSGQIPESFGSLNKLSYLYLYNNSINGSLPQTIGNHTSLKGFSLQNNNITGQIPESLWSLNNVESLNLSNNELSGELVISELNLEKCYSIALNNNNIAGSLPLEICQLPKIMDLKINDNNFSGKLPLEMQQLVKLYNLDISNNNFTGDVPDFSNAQIGIENNYGLKLADNNFTFSNIAAAKITDNNFLWYNPQKKLSPTNCAYFCPLNESISLDITELTDLKHQNNVYKWYKAGTLISQGKTLQIGSMQEANVGDYVCKVSNSTFPDLEIECMPVNIEMQGAKVNVLFAVNMQEETVSADGVFLKGSWDNWTQEVKMIPEDNVFRTSIAIDLGDNIEYKFINGDPSGAGSCEWEQIPEECKSMGNNRYATVSEVNMILDEVCFSSCTNCLQLFQINTLSNPIDGGDVVGAGQYHNGETVNLTVNEKTIYQLANWTENDIEVSADKNYSFIALEDRVITANFELKDIIIKIQTNPIDVGEVWGDGTYKYGDIVSGAANPGSWADFINWTLNGIEVSTERVYTFTATENITLVVNFVLKSYEITASAHPAEGGTINGTGTINIGETASLEAIPESNYHFVNWTENEVELSLNKNYSFVVDGDRILSANFKLNTAVSFINENKITVYPNPVKNSLSLKLKQSFPYDIDVNLYNCDGKLVLIEKLNRGTNHLEIGTAELAKGVYFIKIEGDDEAKIIQKFIKIE